MIKSISIVTPSYNQGEFIEETIKSIWSQKGDFELEHIIADGGSQDQTLEIIKKYDNLYRSKKYPFQCQKFTFKWWSRKDKGQTDAINQGFQIAKGEIINWINSDDILVSNISLQKVAEALNKSKADVIVGKGYLIDEKSKIIGEAALLSRISKNSEFQKALPLILKGDFLIQQSVFFKKALLSKTRLDIDLHYCMDWDLYLKFYLSGFRFYFINQHLGALREQKMAKSILMPKRAYEERFLIYQRNGIWSLGRLHSYLKIKTFGNKTLARLIDGATLMFRKLAPFYDNRKSFQK